MSHVCSLCTKEFKQKSGLTAHMKRKTSCVPPVIQIPIEEEKGHIKVVDLFSGAGGLSVGFSKKPFNILFGIEWDKYAAKTYSANFSHPMINKDICEVNAEEMLKQYGEADIVIGGPPCQGFSMAGKRDKNDPRNSLFMEYLRFVKVFKPKYFVLENVPGILTMKTGNGELVIDIIKSEFDAIGYNLKWKVLLACDYGVPQKRKRVIFLGWNKVGVTEPFHPEPTHTKNTYVCMRDILQPKEEVPSKYYHSEKMIAGFIQRKIKNEADGKGFGAQFVKEDEPCYTISARYYKDGSDALVKYSDTEIRRLTEKEAARVQSFPDSFVFPVSGMQTYKQLGNAVACLVGKAIGESIASAVDRSKMKDSL